MSFFLSIQLEPFRTPFIFFYFNNPNINNRMLFRNVFILTQLIYSFCLIESLNSKEILSLLKLKRLIVKQFFLNEKLNSENEKQALKSRILTSLSKNINSQLAKRKAGKKRDLNTLKSNSDSLIPPNILKRFESMDNEPHQFCGETLYYAVEYYCVYVKGTSVYVPPEDETVSVKHFAVNRRKRRQRLSQEDQTSDDEGQIDYEGLFQFMQI